MEVIERIQKSRIVPLIELERPEDSVPLCQALKAGGASVAEIAFRSRAARVAIKMVARDFPEFALGAGAVTTVVEVQAAVDAGAAFAAASGVNPRVARAAQELGLPFFQALPRRATSRGRWSWGATCWSFSAQALGGAGMLKAISSAYWHRGLRYIVSGGIDQNNMIEYLSLPEVIAVAGKWIVAAKRLDAGDWNFVTNATREALERARESAAKRP